ncbi:phosphoglycolate phosphatase [Paenibacillus sp. J45TS6]|uniref:HAD family hydrolase n=1 Tax=Paenibacillus sp. J45TS6 TaxID=2807196 RepID=UPI001B254BC9|nr:HAD family hydrolase [Paenibacillus sp. J45TS6]GIP44666.1 phosphoglycolate phosphatase [Paenibacillus sp. J45TS6]
MGYKNILFDLDGTLTDPKIGITKSISYALNKMGITVESLDELEIFIGPPLAVSFQDFYGFDEAKTNTAIEYYREYFSVTGLYENEVYTGIKELLELLTKDTSNRLFVATSKPQVFAQQIIDHFELSSYFEYVCGSELDGTRSAKAEIIGYLLENFNLNPEETVMIGDRKHDIIGAHHHGIASIAVGYGFGSREELINIQPTYLAQSIQELAELLSADQIVHSQKG